MARIRTIKPEFWDDEKMGTISFMERLMFIGMWTFADDEGIIKANPSYLKSHIFPYDDTLKSEAIEKALVKFAELKMIYRYSVNAQAYAWIIKFRTYQRIDKPQKSTNPSPSIQNGNYAQSIHARDSYTCHLCGTTCSPCQIIGKATDPTVASMDHLIPVSKGGSHYPSNVRTACISCNKSRGNKDLDEFLKEIGSFQEYSENNPGTFTVGMEWNGREGNSKGKEGKVYSDDFIAFWKQYPKRVGKDEAWRAWQKRNGDRPELTVMLSAIEQQKTSDQWTKDNGQYIPNPATWINQGRWNDELPNGGSHGRPGRGGTGKTTNKTETARSDGQPYPVDFEA